MPNIGFRRNGAEVVLIESVAYEGSYSVPEISSGTDAGSGRLGARQ